jgi:hypothetical protein
VILKDGSQTLDRRLDRIAQLDERSRAFAIRGLLPAAEPLKSSLWRPRFALDQGRQGACTNYGLGHNRSTSPRPRRLPVIPPETDPDAVAGMLHAGGLRYAKTAPEADPLLKRLYIRSQRLDEWPGEEPAYSGTSLLAACKAWQEAGLLGEYRWAFGIDDAIATLSHIGSVVFASDWLDGMFETRPDALLEVQGAVAGGHAYAMVGVVLHPQRSRVWRATGEREPLLLGWQSWGESWGPKGPLFAMRAADAEKLLRGISSPGECAVPLDRHPAS